jgi:two-component system chemotaxis response regulator CheB
MPESSLKALKTQGPDHLLPLDGLAALLRGL